MKDQGNDTSTHPSSDAPGPRRPRIALMGEFSAGKSTLANLMIGEAPLPVQVVATQLPPVWISYGDAPTSLVDEEGRETRCDLDSLQGAVPESVAFIRHSSKEEILRHCDIIDMPGISDPNMSSSVWEGIMPLADGVVWCSPSTQAWRQSEAAVWSTMSDKIRANSMLLLTRGDMLLTARDKAKVIRRVSGEAGDLFGKIQMISLLHARDEPENSALWDESGAEAFAVAFLEMVERIAGQIEGTEGTDAKLDFAKDRPRSDEAVTEGEVDPDRVVPKRPVLRKQEPCARDTVTDAAPDLSAFMPKFS